MLRYFFKLSLLVFFITGNSLPVFAQCCGAGSGSPIAGGGSVGVLAKRQIEFNSNYQYISSSKFLNGTKKDTNFIDNFSSNYQYTRIGYGLTENLTLSMECGYFYNKTQIGLDKRDTMKNHGFGDLIIFPRYNVFTKVGESTQTDLTVGLGYKIPLSRPIDSAGYLEPFSGQTYYYTMPPVMQTSTGSNDVIVYALFHRGYFEHQFKVFANALYIHKGWNELGEKFGDYASFSVFTSKVIRNRYGIMAQIKGEWLDSAKVNKNLNMMGSYNYEVGATGSKKIFFIPQFTYIYKSFSVFALAEIPLYQFVNKVQIASHYQIMGGITYRFLIPKKSA